MSGTLIQGSIWFAATTCWLLAAVLARGVSWDRTARGRAPRLAWMVLCLLGGSAAAVHLFWHDAGEPIHLVHADWVAGALQLAMLASAPSAARWGPLATCGLRWRVAGVAGLVAAALLWPAAWLAAGLVEPLKFTDFLPWGVARSMLALALAAGALAAVWRARERPRHRRHLVPLWFALTMCCGLALAEMLAAVGRARAEQAAEMRVRSLAFAIDAGAADELEIGPETHRSAAYAVLRQQLRQLRRANPDIAYLYLAAIHEGRLVYPVSGAERYLATIDGEPTVVPEPNEPYEDGYAVDEAFVRRFREGGPVWPEFLSDPNYGALLTALAPVDSARGPGTRLMLGMDLRAQIYLGEARRMRRFAQLLTLGGVGALLIFLRYQISSETAESDRLARAAADQRESARNEFIGMVSHELQTPVHAILAHTHTLEDKAAAAAIETHTTDLQRLVEDLLQASALQNPTFRLHPRRSALAPLLHEAAATAMRQAEIKGLRFIVQLGPRLPTHVVVDALRFRQVVVNLLSNAVKYTPHGAISLTVDRVDLNAPDSVACTLEVVVRDTGPGLPAEVLARLGEPFTRGLRTAGQQAGTGLGLAVTRALCEHMHGELTVGANAPHGTVFTARVRAELAGAESAVASAPAPVASAGIALVVEDHPTLRVHLAEQVEGLGWTALTAGSAAEADEALAGGAQPVVVLVDQNLPDALGAACIARWRAFRPCPWIIGISASRDPAVADAMLAAGADDFLYKPVSLAALREALVQRTTSSGATTPPELASEIAGIRAAVSDGQWERSSALAHHLLNTVIALQLGEAVLARTRALEDAIRSRDAATTATLLASW